MHRNWWATFLSLLITFSCLAGFIYPAHARENNYRLDFGKVEPYEETVVQRSLLTCTVSPDFSGMVVEPEPYLYHSTGRKISIHRVNLAVNNQLFELGESPLRIKKSQISPGNILNFLVKLKLAPQDEPGIYEGKIMIRLVAESTARTFQEFAVDISVEIKPWVRIETDDKVLILDRITNDKSTLQNSQSLAVRVASNTDWVLYAALLKSGNLTKKDDISIVMNANASPDVQLEPVFIQSSKDQRKILALGTQTTSKGYWRQIDLAVMLKDILKYPAGRYDFELQFMLEQWDEKTR